MQVTVETKEQPTPYKQRKEETRQTNSRVICIMGESGTGKTTSLRNLNPLETCYIDADGKGLSWKGWRSQYNAGNKNYYQSSDANMIKASIMKISSSRPDVKYVVVDTLNAIMIDDEMRRLKEKGYDKWQDLAISVYDLISFAYTLRSDLWTIFLAHTQTERDDNGAEVFTRMKTSGRKLEKICLESRFNTVLLSRIIDGRHVFETRANNSTARSPFGAFEEDIIDNDIVKVIENLKEF